MCLQECSCCWWFVCMKLPITNQQDKRQVSPRVVVFACPEGYIRQFHAWTNHANIHSPFVQVFIYHIVIIISKVISTIFPPCLVISIPELMAKLKLVWFLTQSQRNVYYYFPAVPFNPPRHVQNIIHCHLLPHKNELKKRWRVKY
jgi:hypothetical protein